MHLQHILKISQNNEDGVNTFPYYGGFKSHSHSANKNEKAGIRQSESSYNFDSQFNKIQEAAARLVAIQEIAKRKGSFSNEDNQIYADNLFELGMAAQNLAQLQKRGEIKDFSKLLQGSNTQNKPQTTNEPPLTTTDSPTQVGDSFVPVNQDDPFEDFGDSVAVSAPKKDASVAEAKPVGLSIAGTGGVASSKPNAVAIAGREGLAVASPKATAIAGVTPEEAAAFSVNVPSQNHIIIKNTDNENGTPNIEKIKSASFKNVYRQQNDYDRARKMTQLRTLNGSNSHSAKLRVT